MLFSWLEAHPVGTLTTALVLLLALFNLLAYRYVYAFTHFNPETRLSGDLEAMTLTQRVQWLCWPTPQVRPELTDRPERHGLSCAVHRFAGSRGRLEGWYIAHRAPSHLVLLFHAYRSCKARMLAEAKIFHDLGCACFLIDFPGSGGSEGDAVSIGYHEAVDVARAVEHARSQWPHLPLVLFGQSMGSAAILRALAVHRVRADAAILECPFDRLLATVSTRFHNVGVPSFPAAHFFLFWGGLQLGYNPFAHNPVEYAARVTLPVCLLYGSKDRRVSCRQVQSIFDRLQGPRELHVFEGLGHDPYVPHQPEKWKEIVERFLGRFPVPSADPARHAGRAVPEV